MAVCLMMTGDILSISLAGSPFRLEIPKMAEPQGLPVRSAILLVVFFGARCDVDKAAVKLPKADRYWWRGWLLFRALIVQYAHCCLTTEFGRTSSCNESRNVHTAQVWLAMCIPRRSIS